MKNEGKSSFSSSKMVSTLIIAEVSSNLIEYRAQDAGGVKLIYFSSSAYKLAHLDMRHFVKRANHLSLARED